METINYLNVFGVRKTLSETQFSVEIQPIIPRTLARLAGLANDRVYSWRHQVRMLFAYLAGSLASMRL